MPANVTHYSRAADQFDIDRDGGEPPRPGDDLPKGLSSKEDSRLVKTSRVASGCAVSTGKTTAAGSRRRSRVVPARKHGEQLAGS